VKPIRAGLSLSIAETKQKAAYVFSQLGECVDEVDDTIKNELDAFLFAKPYEAPLFQ